MHDCCIRAVRARPPIILSRLSLRPAALEYKILQTEHTYLCGVFSLLKKGEGLPSLPALHSAGGAGWEGTMCAAPRNNL